MFEGSVLVEQFLDSDSFSFRDDDRFMTHGIETSVSAVYSLEGILYQMSAYSFIRL